MMWPVNPWVSGLAVWRSRGCRRWEFGDLGAWIVGSELGRGPGLQHQCGGLAPELGPQAGHLGGEGGSGRQGVPALHSGPMPGAPIHEIKRSLAGKEGLEHRDLLGHALGGIGLVADLRSGPAVLGGRAAWPCFHGCSRPAREAREASLSEPTGTNQRAPVHVGRSSTTGPAHLGIHKGRVGALGLVAGALLQASVGCGGGAMKGGGECDRGRGV